MNMRIAHDLILLPGSALVRLLVRVGQAPSVVARATPAFLDGWRDADALLSFSPVKREA